MTKETVLKKEFKQRDVERLRNLVKGKYGERTTVGIGYSKPKEFHNEGDVWEENGRQWTIKNGIKQNITKLDKAKKLVVMPLFCPCCNNLMKKKNDKLFYIHPHLTHYEGFWKRLWFGLKYAFGYKSRFGAFDEFIFKPEDLEQLKTFLKDK